MYLIDITPNDDRWYSLDDLLNEEWRGVIECPTCYMCSNYGRIKTLGRNGTKTNGQILKPIIKRDGYYQVVLQVYGKHLYRRVNRIIAEAFVDNINNNEIVDHIDNNKLNNRYDNLQWLNYKQNSQKYFNENYDNKYKGRGKIKPKKIQAKNEDKTLIFDSMFICAVSLFGNKNKRNRISKSCKLNKPYKGWYFKILE